MPRQELLDSIHALANHAAIIDSCSEALKMKMPALVAANVDEPLRTELVEIKKIVDDLAGGATRLVLGVRHARNVLQQGG